MTQLISFDSNTQKNLDRWLTGHYDEETKTAIKKMLQEKPQEIIDAFYTNLTFGTAGMRGMMGVGCNRLNLYTIQTATQALANYIKKQPKTDKIPSVFIGYDSRNHSKEFAVESAKVLAANGIQVYIFKELRPTPLVSFGCRYKQCTAAIMITASHNPPEYNGYKVYWSDGGQVLPPHDVGIIKEYEAITDIDHINLLKTTDTPLITWVDKEIDEAYLETINKLQLYPKENRAFGSGLKVVYTGLHGTGITLMPAAMKGWGFTDLVLVPKQNDPDGNFPTAKVPNPEDKKALALGIETLKKNDADILIATDPDADRVGVAFKHGDTVEILNGNQIACICLEHICRALSENKKLPKNAAFIKSVVTTELFRAISEGYKCLCVDVLTGFKYIAEKIREWELDTNGYQFIFGGEESYGYLLGTQTRDKDAILMGVLLCEVALHAKLKQKTLLDLLNDIYKKYGVYYEKVFSVVFEESKAGKEQMVKGMAKIRHSPPQLLNGIQVEKIEDFQSQSINNLLTGKQEKSQHPQADIVAFWLADGSKMMVRPSGTEPKIKIYCGVIEKEKGQGVPAALKDAESRANALLDQFTSMLKG